MVKCFTPHQIRPAPRGLFDEGTCTGQNAFHFVHRLVQFKLEAMAQEGVKNRIQCRVEPDHANFRSLKSYGRVETDQL